MSNIRDRPIWLLAAFWISVAIAIAAVVRRLVALFHPARDGPSQVLALDAVFSSHAGLTMMHIVPAAIFVLLAAAVLLSRSRSAFERPFFIFGAITGATAYMMSVYSVGGWTERSAVLVFNTWFLWSLSRAYILRQRIWMLRAVGVLLGISTTRPIMGIFFATSSRTHLGPDQFFGIAFWIGFSINVALTELWLRTSPTRPRPAG